MVHWLRAFIVLCAAALLWQGRAHAQDRLDAHVLAAAKLLDARAQAALEQMPSLERQLLAMRGYLRSGTEFGDRWSWTSEQIDAYERSREKRAALEEIERIRARFAAMNPGYTLHVNTAVRSLDVQIARWNTNAGVARTAQQLRKAAARELEKRAYPPSPTLGSTAQFAAFLKSWVPGSPAPLATPGLSRHGQARAFDFHIMYGDRSVASTNMNLVRGTWDRQGWTKRLKAAVEGASDRFLGPLIAPYEPWHYEYIGNDTRVAEAETAPAERATAHESGS